MLAPVHQDTNGMCRYALCGTSEEPSFSWRGHHIQHWIAAEIVNIEVMSQPSMT